MDRFRDIMDEDQDVVDEQLIPAGRVALRTIAVLLATMLVAGLSFGLLIGLAPTETGAQAAPGPSAVLGLVVGAAGFLFFLLPVVVTVLAARGKMAHSKRSARIVMGVLVAALWLFTSLVVFSILGLSNYGQYFALAWPGMLITFLVGVLLAPWLVSPRVGPDA